MPAWVRLVGFMNASQAMDSDLNISPKMSRCAWAWYRYLTELRAYDFAIKDFVVKKGQYLCWALYMCEYILSSLLSYISFYVYPYTRYKLYIIVDF